ncbi:hypothetical protein FA15DRAFT_662213, partial [Coprinopsis marcescibilis]
MTQDFNLVPEFINKFQKTLTRLSISHYSHTTAIGIPTYDSLVRFPNLISVTLQPGSRGYAGFIKQHADSLLELQCPIGPFPDGIGPIKFRKLKKVTLTAEALVRWEPESSWWMSSSPFLKSILPTVRSLRISHWCTGEEIATFLETVNRLSGHVEPLLAELSICFQTFSVDSLPAIATAFPKLRTLEITFLDIVTEGAPWTPIRPDKSFPFAENRLKYVPFARRLIHTLSGVAWGLEGITVKCQGWPVDIPMWGVMYMCGQFIPSILSFNSTGNMTIPEERWANKVSAYVLSVSMAWFNFTAVLIVQTYSEHGTMCERDLKLMAYCPSPIVAFGVDAKEPPIISLLRSTFLMLLILSGALKPPAHTRMRRRAIEEPTPKSVELPPEIWDQIAGHLQGNTL